MISEHDIIGMADETLTAGDTALDKAAERLERGVKQGREIMPNEVRPLIMAALAWRRAAMNLWADKMQAGQDATRLHHADSKYVRTEAGQ
jgi:hypothetical protein